MPAVSPFLVHGTAVPKHCCETVLLRFSAASKVSHFFHLNDFVDICFYVQKILKDQLSTCSSVLLLHTTHNQRNITSTFLLKSGQGAQTQQTRPGLSSDQDLDQEPDVGHGIKDAFEWMQQQYPEKVDIEQRAAQGLLQQMLQTLIPWSVSAPQEQPDSNDDAVRTCAVIRVVLHSCPTFCLSVLCILFFCVCCDVSVFLISAPLFR